MVVHQSVNIEITMSLLDVKRAETMVTLLHILSKNIIFETINTSVFVAFDFLRNKNNFRQPVFLHVLLGLSHLLFSGEWYSVL